MGNIIFDETSLYEEIDNYGPIEYAEHNFYVRDCQKLLTSNILLMK